jgi:hypothetical protein
MDTAAFRRSLQAAQPPSPLSLPLQALWWDAKGDWDRAHQCAQADNGPHGAAVHAYLHRKEPDPANARYWYNRAGRPHVSGSLEQEWDALAAELLTGQAAGKVLE